MINNMDKPLDESLKNKRSAKKANEVFQKILAKNHAKKNPWDEVRSYTSPSMRETKPEVDLNDQV